VWVGEDIKIPFVLSIFMGLFVVIANWNNIFGSFINGIGKVRIQLYYSVFVAVLNIPLSIFLAKDAGLGITGVIISTNICLIMASIWSPIQYLKIINGRATGIWNR
jgi:O-antigen/teichoic acid export membrane protein